MFETLTVNGATIVHANNKGASYTCMLTKGAVNSGDASLGIKDIFGVNPEEINNPYTEITNIMLFNLSLYLFSTIVDTDDAVSTFAHIVRNDIIDKLSVDASIRAIRDISKCVGFTVSPHPESASKSYIGYQIIKIMDGDTEYRVFITIRDFSIEIIILNVSDKI